jgi:hypothetical protein
MKMKKILLPILALALMFMTNSFSFAEETVMSYIAEADFYDFDPDLIHDSPRVTELISCNMVLKPKTQAHLSRLCGSAIGNVKYYMNDEETNIQTGPDYNVVDTGEEYILFYPATKLISNSYIGGMINYKASCDFQTKKSNGEKIQMEVPVDVYKSAVIISSKTVYIDMGREYTLSQPTGDQSQPNWVGVKPAYPSLLGRRMNWTFRFGTLDNSVSGAFGLFKVKMKNYPIIDDLCYEVPELTPDIAAAASELTVVDDVVYLNGAQTTSLNEEYMAICNRAKKVVMQYNLSENPTEDGWVNIDEGQARQFLKVENNTLYYPRMANAWGRIIAVLEVPTADDCKPVRRTIVKGRIGSKYPGFEFKNMKEGDVLKIYNVNGKKIREINSGTAEGFVWDGRDDSGDWAKSGIYIYQLKVDGKLINGTIAFVY